MIGGHDSATRNYDGANWRERDDTSSPSLAGETRTFSDEMPWSVAGTFSRFGAMNESESSLMPHVRSRTRSALYRG
jgi:hypothetical protein